MLQGSVLQPCLVTLFYVFLDVIRPTYSRNESVFLTSSRT